jgi:hypothetical protein
MMMSQAKKYLWIDTTNYWGYIIFARMCAMISDFEHSCRTLGICMNPDFDFDFTRDSRGWWLQDMK